MPTDFVAKPPYNVLQPGAYSAVQAALVSNANPLAGRPIPMILGTALGGQPLKPLYFTSPGLLAQTLRGGPGYDVARFAFDGGASQVGFVRVGNSVTAASLALTGTSGTAITLTALDWGSWCNAITITVATGPTITLQYTDQYGVTNVEQWNFTGVSGLTVATIVSAINGGVVGYPASNYVSAAAGAGTLPLTNVSNAPLTGGTDGSTPLAGDWTNGLTAIQTELVDIVVPATSDATVHAQCQTHCQLMSVPNARHERVGIYGAAIGETVTQQVSRMAALNSGRSQLVYPGMYDYNSAGTLTLYDSFYKAGKLAGMYCALPDPATSLVHNTMPYVADEVDLSTVQGGAIDQLLAAGVTPTAKQPGGGYWLVDALTGYTGTDGTFRDMVKTRSADYVAQYSRITLEAQFVGSKKLASSKASITSAATKVLDDLVAQQIIYGYQLPIVEPGPNKNAWTVNLPVQLIDTTKFIFITVQLQPSSTVTGSVTAADQS